MNMVIIENTPVETGKVVRAIFEDDQATDLETLDAIVANYNAQVAAWRADYRHGYSVGVCGGLISDIDASNETMVQGLRAGAESITLACEAAHLLVSMFGREAFK